MRAHVGRFGPPTLTDRSANRLLAELMVQKGSGRGSAHFNARNPIAEGDGVLC